MINPARALKILSLSMAIFISNSSGIVHANTPNIENVTVSNKNPQIGDVVTWKVYIDCGAYPVQFISISLIDSLNVSQFASYGNSKSVDKTSKTRGIFEVSLKITNEAPPGQLSVNSVYAYCPGYDKNINYAGDLDAISLSIPERSTFSAYSPPSIDSVEMLTPNARKVGEKVTFRIRASSSGKINVVWIFIRSPEGIELYQLDSSFYGNGQFGELTKRADVQLSFEVNKDWTPGEWSIAKVDVNGWAGIDPSNPNNELANPYGTTAVAYRQSFISNTPGINSSFIPSRNIPPQADISKIRFTVSNPEYRPISAPELIEISADKLEVRAGESFTYTFSVDGKGGYIYNVSGYLADIETYNNISSDCTTQFETGKTLTRIIKGKLTCKVLRKATIGENVLRQFSIYTTSCEVSPERVGFTENCQQAPRQRYTNYLNSYNKIYTETSPKQDNFDLSAFSKLPNIKVLPPDTLKRPELLTSEITDTEVKLSYPADWDLACTYDTSKGQVNSNLKSPGQVSIIGLKPNSKVTLSATCVSTDNQRVTFQDEFTTKLPGLPPIPKIIDKKIDLNSLTLTFIGLTNPDYDYEIDSNVGTLIVLGDTVKVSGLKPSETVEISIKVTDQFGQKSEGKLATLTTSEPPRIFPPRIESVASSSNLNYKFIVSREKSYSYSIDCSNCRASILGEKVTVFVANKKKRATAYVIVKDSYGQSLRVKLLDYKGK